MCRGQYTGFNPTFASEKLFERNKIAISRETLRQWFIAGGIKYDKRKARPHRQWRERKAYCGEMVQMDGSHHDWLEGRGERCVLMGYIDDASSRVYARFYKNEGTLSAMESFKRYGMKYGLPASIYLDRHAAYKAKGQATVEEELAGREPMSQFESTLEELGKYLPVFNKRFSVAPLQSEDLHRQLPPKMQPIRTWGFISGLRVRLNFDR